MNFSPKRAVEVDTFTVDFGPRLRPGETLLEPATWSVAACDGSDANAASMLRGAASITGSKVSQLIGGGVPRTTYAPVCTVQTSEGRTLTEPEEGFGHLYVSA